MVVIQAKNLIYFLALHMPKLWKIYLPCWV